MTMASSLLHCSLIAPPISPHRPILFRNRAAKLPSPSLSHSSPRVYVPSCSGHNQKESGPGPKFDRRDMLLGMSGLYTATNLANAPGYAAPIPPVTLDKCGTATEISDGTAIEPGCCPPYGQPQNYVLPPVPSTGPRKRPSLQSATSDQMQKFELAIQKMRDLSETDPDDPRGFKQQSHVHCAYCNLAYPQSPDSNEKLQIHFNWLFFPWHRWYLYFYERICAHMIGETTNTFALPFWNWDNPSGMYVPDIFKNKDSSLYNKNRNTDHYSQTPNLLYDYKSPPPDPTKVIQNNLVEMYNEVIQNGTTLEAFYGGKYSLGSKNNWEMGTIEKGSHTALHQWVGQNTPPYYNDMGNFSTAGNDMLFFCHHSNIDRLWKVWCDMRTSNNLPNTFPDDDWLSTEFVFYDEDAKPVIVKVSDCLDNEKMGYTWEPVKNPWMDCKPSAFKKKSTFAKTTKAPKATDTSFPVKLDKVLRVLVNRPKKRRSAKVRDNEIELLVIEDIVVESSQSVRFEVFVNDEDLKPEELISTAEYAGCFSQVPLTNPGKITTKTSLCLDKLLEELDVEDDDEILVSVVPKDGGEFITIGGIKIVYESMID